MNKREGTVYVYKLYDLKGKLIYIGETVDLNRRIREHKDNYILGKVSYCSVSNKYESVRLEASLIKDLKPLYNKRLVSLWAEEGTPLKNKIFKDVSNLDMLKPAGRGIKVKDYYKEVFSDMVFSIKDLHSVSSFDEVLRSVYHKDYTNDYYGCFISESLNISVGLYIHSEHYKVVIGSSNLQLRGYISDYFRSMGVVVAIADRVIKNKINTRVLTRLIENSDWLNSENVNI